MGIENSVISVNSILLKPYKHAGGFQISNNLITIGVKDNSARLKSKVFDRGKILSNGRRFC